MPLHRVFNGVCRYIKCFQRCVLLHKGFSVVYAITKRIFSGVCRYKKDFQWCMPLHKGFSTVCAVILEQPHGPWKKGSVCKLSAFSGNSHLPLGSPSGCSTGHYRIIHNRTDRAETPDRSPPEYRKPQTSHHKRSDGVCVAVRWITQAYILNGRLSQSQMLTATR